MKIRILTCFGILWCCIAQSQDTPKTAIETVLDDWHRAAARADFETYFGYMTEDAVFIGTDPTEYWAGEAFRKFSKPYFDRGKAWDFKVVERHVYWNNAKDLAWFDELLDTRMEICRGSGVLQKINGNWKIVHYVLSLTVPNEDVNELVQLKKESDSLLLLQLQKH